MVLVGIISYDPKKPEKGSNNEKLKRELVPVTGIEFQIKLMDYSAQVTIRQRFENRESSLIEATYEIILPRECAVTSFAATVAGQRVNAVVREKESAKDAYDDAIASGGSAVLLENDALDDRPDVFRVSVGNLAPHDVATTSLTYVTTADVNDDGNVEFTLPAAQGSQDIVIAPPSENTTSGNGNGNDNDNEEGRVADGIHLTADIAMGSDIRSVASPTYRVVFELGDTPRRARVTLDEALRGGDDFTLTVATAQPRAPSVRIHRPAAGKPQATVMASFFPDLEEGEKETSGLKEMIFVVDRSGSMGGSKMENAKATLQLFLRSIPEGTLFNVVSFGDGFVKLFDDGSRPLDDETLKKASSHVSSMSANMGGTELVPPLASVFSEAPREGVPRVLFVLTDGEVENPDECIRYIRDQAQTTRVFTFGIGRDASVALVRRMARAGEGRCELIQDAANMREKVMRQLKRAVRPALTGLSVAWENCGCAVHQAPHILPPLFHGSRLVVYGFAEDGDALAVAAGNGAAVVLRGVLDGTRPFESRVSLEGVEEGSEEQVTKLAAAALIRDLEEDRSYHGKEFAEKNAEVVRVSTENGVLSSLTAFVAVTQPRGDAPAQESMVERPVTIEPLEGWRADPYVDMANYVPPGSFKRAKKKNGGKMGFSGFVKWLLPKVFARNAVATCANDGGAVATAEPTEENAPADVLLVQEAVVMLQGANGSWDPAALAEIEPPAYKDAMEAIPAGPEGAKSAEDETLRRVWATLVVVAVLEIRCAKTAGEWELIRDKAVAWVRKVTAKCAEGEFDLDAWAKAAREYVTKKNEW